MLHKHKCQACSYYTIFQITPMGHKATNTCTHCGDEQTIPWDNEIRSMFKQTQKALKDMEEFCPELKDLKEAGDHVLIS